MTQTAQPVAQTTSSNGQPNGLAAAKVPGIGANSKGLMVKGSPIGSEQVKVANIILAVGAQESAPTEALVAAVYAGMGENDLHEGGAGVFQTTGVPSAYSGGSDTAGQAKGFFTGGVSFNGPGAIARAKQGQPAWEIANATENNLVWMQSHGDSYAHQFPGGQAQGISEARAIVQAGGAGAIAGGSGSALGGSGVPQPYYFTVGAHETYWGAMQRLADEVGWRLFTDGNRMYYDSDLALIRQKPAAVIHRDDPSVVSWSGDWDARHICTQLSLTLICSEFEFRPGEVLQLAGFGPYSTGSTAGLPGRWLISDYTRTKGDVSSIFTLVQPTRPKLEPTPQIASAPSAANSAGRLTAGLTSSLQGSTTKAKIADAARKACAIEAANHSYYVYSEQYDRAAAARRGLFATAPVTLDCSGFASACYQAAGAPDPGGTNYASYGTTFTMEPRGTKIALAQAQPGDLVFYPGHVAVYLGGNQIANHGSPNNNEPLLEPVSAPHGGVITSVRSYL